MLAPLKWLKEYVDIDIDIKEYADRMIMSGSMVESVEESGKEIVKVVVGKIIKHGEHPQADRLSVNQVDVGSEVIQIVTGATNIKEGDFIPVAMVGSTLPGNVKIKKGKLRGVESCGMMCSAEELGLDLTGLSDELLHGIYILNKEYPLGMDIKEVLSLNDAVIEFEITNNRPDCLSILGLARETAATLGKKLHMPSLDYIEDEKDNIKNYIDVEVTNENLCKRYTCKVIKNVNIKPSPGWMQDRLAKSGVRSINNIVDITNYIMLEFGQPLHAFDYRMIDDKKIIVRTANPNEKIITLDGKERSLSENILLITDKNKAIAIAGVMGAENSEIKDDTQTVVIEFATFDAINTRLASKKLGLRTDASSKFEKGLDTELTMLALHRTCSLIEELGAGEIVGGVVDIYPNIKKKRSIHLRRGKMNAFIGLEFSAEEIKNYLESVGIKCSGEDDIDAEIPTYRDDIEGEADLAEEVSRLYGYDKLPSKIMDSDFTAGGKTLCQQLTDKAKMAMVAQGHYETCMYSFVSPNVFSKINLNEDSPLRRAIRIINPLGEDQSIMRTTMIPNMMDVIAKNFNKKVDNGKFFEISKIYLAKELPITGPVNEQDTLIIGSYGKDTDIFTLKGSIENLLRTLKIDNYKIVQGSNESFHPGRTALLLVNNEEVGYFGEIHPSVAKNYDIDVRVQVAELNFVYLLEKARIYNQYKSLPKYPAVTRDIAMIAAEEITCAQIEDIIYGKGGKIVESVKLFDIYRGSQIESGYKSMAYGIVYRSSEKTLDDETVLKVHNKILSTLENQLGVTLRK